MGFGHRRRCGSGGGRRVTEADRHTSHPGDGVRRRWGARRAVGHRRGDNCPDGRGCADARRGDACRGAVRRCLADQASSAQARVRGAIAPARDRAPAHHRPGRRAGGSDLRAAQCPRGDRPGDRPGAHGCRPRRGGGDGAATPIAYPPGPERGERPQRRDLRAPAADRTGGGGGRGQLLDQPSRDPRRLRADRLRTTRRRGGGIGRRRGGRDRLRPRAHQRFLASGHPGRRRRPRLRNRGGARWLRVHCGIRRRRDLRRPRQPRIGAGVTPERRAWRSAGGRHLPRLRGGPPRSRASSTSPGRSGYTRCSA